MIIILIAIVLAVGIYEMRNMRKMKLKKEMFVFIVIAILSLVTGIYYTMDPFGESIAQYILGMLGMGF